MALQGLGSMLQHWSLGAHACRKLRLSSHSLLDPSTLLYWAVAAAAV